MKRKIIILLGLVLVGAIITEFVINKPQENASFKTFKTLSVANREVKIKEYTPETKGVILYRKLDGVLFEDVIQSVRTNVFVNTNNIQEITVMTNNLVLWAKLQPKETTFEGHKALGAQIYRHIDWTNYDLAYFSDVLIDPPITTNDLANVIPFDVVTIQNQKNQMLISLIDLYKSFLKDEWTIELRKRNIISAEQEITVSNTDSGQNMLYLMILRSTDTEANKPTYSYYKNEFETFRNNIERLGGNMANL